MFNKISLIPEKIEFTKINAGGNDFICLDNTGGQYDSLLESEYLPEFIRKLCKRGLSVGADGVLFACETGTDGEIDIIARFLEADGSEAEICGNGTACFVYWLYHSGIVKKTEISVLTAAGNAYGEINENGSERVKVCLPDPKNFQPGISLTIDDRTWEIHYLETGVPHCVIFVDDLENVDVHYWGKLIRHHEHFGPRGVNVNFVKIEDKGEISVRTFEFGVENETLACGTGCASSAIITSYFENWDDMPVKIHVKGGETVYIWFAGSPETILENVCLETGANMVYTGVISPLFLS